MPLRRRSLLRLFAGAALLGGRRRSLAMHFGCFPLADDGYGEPAAELEVARRHAGITAEEFALPVPGRTLRFPL
ncbi:MAG: hypothetical protein FJ397_14465 [Verrucomicrobia bacterium]|nr:hypothetical protein [Verrucomicrobiota bacterium]